MAKDKTNIVDTMLNDIVSKFMTSKDSMETIQILNLSQAMFNKEHYGTENPDYERLTIKEKTSHGWMRVQAMTCEAMINGRWAYWHDIRLTHEVEGKPIPQLKFRHGSEEDCKVVADMIKDCLNFLAYKVSGYKGLELFMDWLLYGWGCNLVKSLPPEITDDINDYWYKNFKSQYMFAVPSDYFVKCASEIYGSGKFNATNFYPTPSHIVQFMVSVLFDEKEAEKNKYAGVMEPCMGSGIMLLYQSNHSLRLHGNDIDQLMCKIATVNGYFYVPWLVENDDVTNKLLSDMHDKYNDGVVDVEWTDKEFYEMSHIQCKEEDFELLKAL